MAILLLLLIFFLCLASCEPKPINGISTTMDTSQGRASLQQLREKSMKAIALLRTGDVVLRCGRGPDSYLLANLNQRDKNWSHCGIVVIENGKPFVYHSMGGEDNPGLRLMREPAFLFMTPLYNKGIGIVRYDASIDTSCLVNVIHAYYRKRPLFDMQFDLATDDKLYCSEFVYKSLMHSTTDSALMTLSTAMGRKYVGIDDLFLNRHARVIWKVMLK